MIGSVLPWRAKDFGTCSSRLTSTLRSTQVRRHTALLMCSLGTVYLQEPPARWNCHELNRVRPKLPTTVWWSQFRRGCVGLQGSSSSFRILTCSFRSSAGLQWLLKRSQHVKSINLLAEERPGGVNELRNLSMPLIEVSCNLQHLEELVRPLLYTMPQHAAAALYALAALYDLAGHGACVSGRPTQVLYQCLFLERPAPHR